jgi:predicted dehydrogenase
MSSVAAKTIRPKVAVVGLGSQGGKHVRAALPLQARGQLELVATCDPQFISSAAKRHYQHFDAMVTQESLDIVILAVPNMYHQHMTKQALAKGCAVIKEKPVALSLEDVSELQRIAAARNLSVITCQQRFFKEEWLQLKALVTASKEKVVDFNFTFCVNDKQNSWYWDVTTAGGGVWLNMGWHSIQMIAWMLGDVKKVTFTSNSGGKRSWAYQTEHSVLATVTLQSGIVGTLFVSCVHPQQDSVRIKTKQTVISLSDTDSHIKLQKVENGSVQVVPVQQQRDPYQLQLETYLDWIAVSKNTLQSDQKILTALLSAEEQQGTGFYV